MLWLVLAFWTAGAHAEINAQPDHDPWPLVFGSHRISELAQLAPLSGISFSPSAIAPVSAVPCNGATCSSGAIVPSAFATVPAEKALKAQIAFELRLPPAPVTRLVEPSLRSWPQLPEPQTLLLLLSLLFWPALAGLFILVGHWCWLRWFHYDKRMERAARAGLARGEFHIEYQPLVSIRGRVCVGMDAMLRWANPDFGKIGSANYMAVLERCSWIGTLMKYALARVAQEIGELSEARLLYVIVDIPLACLTSESFFRWLIEIVTMDRTHRIVVGLDHKALGSVERTLSNQMAHARARGVIFALTGLGADEGSDAFRYPKELSFEIIKVDRRIFSLTPPQRARRLQSLASAAREMDAMLIVDGVDTGVHHDVLRSVGGEFGQGFFYSRPLAMRRLKSFLQGSARARFL
ncbi:EAL domain-containing protein [Pararobbsia alpina]|nr:EAL domain-containing protein [Pararobbsia alpina]